MKTLLIDGNSLINRAFYALPILSTEEGVYTNGVYGFLKMFYKVIDEYEPDNVVCAFDVKKPTFRHQHYSEYKAGRKKMPDELVPQIPLLKEVLGQLGVFCTELAGYEADDIIGTYALKSEEVSGETVILTGDRDSFQLISPLTTVWFTKKGITDVEKLTPLNLKDFYGVEPDRVCDLKALMGDSSDNIPGVAGVGEKTALELINKYGSIEEIYEHTDELKGKLQEKIINGKDAAFDSKFLVTIFRQVPDCHIENTKYVPCDDTVAAEVFNKYGFKSLLERVGGTVKEHVVETKEYNGESFEGKRIAVYRTDNEVFIAENETQQYRISLSYDLLCAGMDEESVKMLLQPIMTDETVEKVFFDSKLERHFFGEVKNVTGDVLLLEYLLDTGNDDLSFERIASKYSAQTGAAQLLYIYSKQREALKNKQLTALYEEIELPLAKVLYEMEKEGFYVDSAVLRQLGNEFSEKIKELSEEIFFLAGREFNINSPIQLSEVLFEELKLPHGKKTKRGYSTDNDVLENLEHPIVKPIIEYRQMQKLKSTYIDGMYALVSQKDGRIHSTFRQAVTATGRISSTEPNLQNIPVRYVSGRAIRRAFLAEKQGTVLVNADYSQIELRILAHLSGDKTLIDSFKNNEDIHARTAAEVFGIDIKDVTSVERGRAKAVNFGIVYGISDFGLSKSTGSTRQEAREFMEKYFERYPQVEAYLKAAVQEAKKCGYATTVMGRRREIKELRSQNFNVRSFGERVAMNTPIQGSAADIIKLAMLKVSEALKELPYEARLILQVHDELILEVDEAHAEECSALLKSIMESVYELDVPLIAETNVGRTWFELK